MEMEVTVKMVLVMRILRMNRLLVMSIASIFPTRRGSILADQPYGRGKCSALFSRQIWQ